MVPTTEGVYRLGGVSARHTRIHIRRYLVVVVVVVVAGEGEIVRTKVTASILLSDERTKQEKR